MERQTAAAAAAAAAGAAARHTIMTAHLAVAVLRVTSPTSCSPASTGCVERCGVSGDWQHVHITPAATSTTCSLRQ